MSVFYMNLPTPLALLRKDREIMLNKAKQCEELAKEFFEKGHRALDEAKQFNDAAEALLDADLILQAMEKL